ncbi:MAG: helix-turn-helix transcriptional regulator [Gaiellales bacterium]
MSQAELDRHEVARWAVDLRNEFEHDDTRAFFVMAHTASYAEFITGSSWNDLSTTFRDLLSKYGDRGANAWFERFLLNQPSWRDVYGSRWTGVSSDSSIVEHLLEYLDARSEAAVGESSVAAETSEYLTQQEVGQRIFELRTERGVSQRCLADAIGVDPSAMSRIESGQRGLAVSELVGISGFLGVPTESLLRRQLTAAPLFRNEGGDAEAADALAAFEAIIDDFFAFEAAART